MERGKEGGRVGRETHAFPIDPGSGRRTVKNKVGKNK